MKSQWTDEGEREAIQRWGTADGTDFALRLYSAGLLGKEPTLCLHGGGNVSFKGKHRTIFGEELDALFIKASGRDLSDLTPGDLVEVDLSVLQRLRRLDSLSDNAMLNELRRCLFDAGAATPSIETLVHAFLPHRFVDHSHADAVLVLANLVEAEPMLREALGERVAVLPYVRPGFELALAVDACIRDHPNVEVIVLSHHGLLTFADNARTSYERHIEFVDACERFIERRTSAPAPVAPGRGADRVLTPRVRVAESASARALRAAPILRGLLAEPSGDEDRPYRRRILEWRATEPILEYVNSVELLSLSMTGPVTGDHAVHTRPTPLVVTDPIWMDQSAQRKQLSEAVEKYRRDYANFIARHGGSPTADSFPRVVLLGGAGLFCFGESKADARRIADLAEHTIHIKMRAYRIGEYAPFDEQHVYDAEHRLLQRVKRGSGDSRSLSGQVVAISGGAGAIGAGIADVCAGAGAHVAVADLDRERIEKVVRRVEQRHGRGKALGVLMDVTDESSVRAGFAEIVRAFGGVDVVVPNAGIAHVGPIDELSAGDFRRVMEVNAAGCLLFMQEGVRIIKQQGLGGHVVINASKNVFAPGKDFAAYSASKAAAHQLGRVAAMELAAFGIRVNMINADAVFGDEEISSALWSQVAPARAKLHGVSPEKLPDYYRLRNLLKAKVLARHVGNAVIFFAGNFTPTTGATLPVDGGLPEAFPR